MAGHRVGQRGSSRRAAAFGCLLLLALPSLRALAADGALDVEDQVQQGQTGPSTYRQSTFRSDLHGTQIVPVAGAANLRFDARLLRELFDSRFDSLNTRLDRTTGQAEASLDVGRRWIRFGLNGNEFRQKSNGGAADTPLLDRQQLAASLNLRQWVMQINANGIFITSRRENLSGPDSRNREWNGSVGTRAAVPRLGDLSYRYSTLIDQDLTLDTRTDQTTHYLSFSGANRFAGGRGLATVKTASTFFTENDRRTLQTAGTRLRLPITGGWILDDTPEVLDPLEGSPTPEPLLYDGNRQTPTGIDLGDSAPVVRQYGGDYRNIQYDFGEAVPIRSAILYVDRTLLSSALFQWRVFTSNDPQGRTWQELPSDAFTAAYREWGTGLQGWQVTLASTVSARFFKMVDVKLGLTVPDLFVTEMEVYTDEPEASTADRSQTNSQRVDGSLAYALSSTVRAGYDVSYHYRTISQGNGPLQDWNHAVSAGWNRNLWAVGARYETRTLEGRQSLNTAVDGQSVSIRHGRSSALYTELIWSRINDHSVGIRKVTNTVSLGGSWAAAPALQIQERVNVGRLSDRIAEETSTSFGLTTSAVGQPFATMTMDVELNDRWVTREAGTGFTRYDNVSASVGWRPVPLVSFSSQLQYQRSTRAQWLTRNTVAWDVLSEGNFKATVSGSHYRDTVSSQTERVGGIQFEWNARPSLSFRGSMESVVLRSSGQENRPLNTDIRGIWRF